ncbi:MAG: hypothetical protein JW854_17015 [Actinobacteria bacterium]|nr:hypothetical protein [Actinomycetota bacterium]
MRTRTGIIVIPVLIIILAAAWIAAGCGNSQDGSAWLSDCGKAVEDYAQSSGYLHFVQEKEYSMGMEVGQFEQRIRVEGDIIFPDRESYEYSETSNSSLQPDQPMENSFSYLTLDGGKTAYVAGERLSVELGVMGWVHYTPQTGQSRYFSYVELMQGLTAPQGDAEWLGFEDLNGERCARIRHSISGQELVDKLFQEDPTLGEQYQDVDMSNFVGEVSFEIWIAEEDGLPRQVVMDQVITLENGANSTTHLHMAFSGYGEEPPLTIEAPAFFTDAV